MPLQRFEEEVVAPARVPLLQGDVEQVQAAPPRSLWKVLVLENPIVAKELRTPRYEALEDSATLLKKRVWPAIWTALLVLSVVPIMLFRYLFPNMLPQYRAEFSYGLYGLLMTVQGMILVMGTNSVMSSIPGEREKQTWNALLLSRLSPAQILVGKLSGAMVPVILAVLGLVPVTLLMAFFGKVAPLSVLGSYAVMLAGSALSATLALHGAWKEQTVRAATRTATHKIGLLMIGAPTLAWAVVLASLLLYFLLSVLFPGQQLATELLTMASIVIIGILQLTSPPVALIVANIPLSRFLGESIPWWAYALQALFVAGNVVFCSICTVRLWKEMLKDFFKGPTDLAGQP